MTAVYTKIPVPNEDPAAMLATIQALVQNVQVLTGQIGTQGVANSIIVFRKKKNTDPTPVGTKNGDLWIQPPVLPTDTWVIQIWINAAWQLYMP